MSKSSVTPSPSESSKQPSLFSSYPNEFSSGHTSLESKTPSLSMSLLLTWGWDSHTSPHISWTKYALSINGLRFPCIRNISLFLFISYGLTGSTMCQSYSVHKSPKKPSFEEVWVVPLTKERFGSFSCPLYLTSM